MPRTRHGLYAMRRSLTTLTTRRLDGRSAIAVAVRQFKADLTADLGGDLSRAQQAILEDAAQAWVIRQVLDDYIVRQPSLITKKRALLPVVRERMQVAEHLAKQLERLGLERRAKPVPDLGDYLAAKLETKAPAAKTTVHPPAPEPAPGTTETTFTTEAGDRMKKEGPGVGSAKSVGDPPGDGNSGVSVVRSSTTP